MHSQGLWDEEDGFFYDVFHAADGTTTPIKVRSMVGVLPLMGMVALGPDLLETLGNLRKRFAGFLGQADGALGPGGRVFQVPGTDALAIGVVPRARGAGCWPGCSTRSEFLSPYGLRALSKYHEEHPLWVDLAGVARLRRLRARRVPHRHVRRQLQLARPGLDAGQLPRCCATSSATRGRSGAERGDRVPHRERRDGRAGGVRRRPAAAARLAVPPGARRTPPLPRLGRQAAERPAVARQHHVQRVLPRRQRRRAGRQPPDRLDRAGGRPDLPAGPVRRATRLPWEL